MLLPDASSFLLMALTNANSSSNVHLNASGSSNVYLNTSSSLNVIASHQKFHGTLAYSKQAYFTAQLISAQFYANNIFNKFDLTI